MCGNVEYKLYSPQKKGKRQEMWLWLNVLFNHDTINICKCLGEKKEKENQLESGVFDPPLYKQRYKEVSDILKRESAKSVSPLLLKNLLK